MMQIRTNAKSGSSSGSIPNSNPPPPAATTGAAVPSSPRHIGEDTNASVSDELAGTTTKFEPLPSLTRRIERKYKYNKEY